MKTKITLLLITLMFCISCSEETTTPSPDPEDNTDNLLPSETGNYWLYNVYNLDSLNIKLNPDNPRIDSLIVKGQKLILTRLASVFVNYIFNGNSFEESGEQYFYNEGQKIFTHSGIFNSILNFSQFKDITLPFKLPEQWIPFIDPTSEQWNIYEKALNGDTAQFQAYILKFYGMLTIKGKKDGKEEIKIDTAKHKAHKFTITISYSGYFTVNAFGEEKFNANFTIPLNFWFVNNIGMVKRIQQSFFITLPFLGDRYILGNQSECYRYNVIISGLD